MNEPCEQITVAPNGRPDATQPKWRRDFPIDRPQDAYVMRREFTKFMVLTSLAFTVGQFWILAQNWIRRRRGLPAKEAIARVSQVPVGSALTFHYPGPADACLLVRPDEKTLVAYNQKCTHLSCAVTPAIPEGCFHCPCHHGYFDLASGRPIAGPPRRPLPKITLEVHGDTIYATGVEVRTV